MDDPDALALEFTRALCARAYDRAYAMTSSDYRSRVSAAEMRAVFETIVPPDWGETEPVEIGMTLPDWPAKQPEDLSWVHVSIYGDVFSEAISAVIAKEGDAPKVRHVEWGRP